MTAQFGTEASRKVIEVLEAAGYEAVFVGGAVRDFVLGKPAKDIDIATSAEPDEVKAVFPYTIDIGIEHGTVLVIMDSEPIEVTTYRTDGTYTDHRRPDTVHFVRSLKEDLLRRDFTMNALAMTKNGELIDLFGGKEDLAQQLIRAVGNPTDRFQEDALRMLRAVRFSSVLNFAIDTQTLQAIRENAERLQSVSIERIKAEMDRLFLGVNPSKAFHYFQETGLHQYLPLFPSSTQLLVQLPSFRIAKEGWAAFMVLGQFSANAMVKAYRLSKEERQFLQQIEQLMMKRTAGPYIIEDYYDHSLHVLQTTERLYRFLHNQPLNNAFEEIENRKKSLPLQSKEELVIRGSDLITWSGDKGGAWTSAWLEKIEREVLHGRCPNDLNVIKEWFLHEYKCKK